MVFISISYCFGRVTAAPTPTMETMDFDKILNDLRFFKEKYKVARTTISPENLSKGLAKIDAIVNVWFKETMGSEKPDSKKLLPRNAMKTTKFINSKESKRCAKNTRNVYKECLKLQRVNKTLEDRSKIDISRIAKNCAEQFSIGYPRCFFGDSIKRKSSDGDDVSSVLPATNKDESCTKVCLIYMDACMFESDKVEQVLCMNARDVCLERCQNKDSDDDNLSLSSKSASSKKLTQSTSPMSKPEKVITTKTQPKKTSLKEIGLQKCDSECTKLEDECKEWTKNDQVCFFANIECQKNCQLKYIGRKK